MGNGARVAWLLAVLFSAGSSTADISFWQMGGNAGLSWAGLDTASVLVDTSAQRTAIRPTYITPERSIFSFLSNWSGDKQPLSLDYFDGQRPRVWRRWDGDIRNGYQGAFLVDGDSTTYNPPSSSYGTLEWYTIDVAVPVPAFRFGFYTPSQGFRSDGLPLRDDAVPAYEISISAETTDAVAQSNQNQPVGQVIAAVRENFFTAVSIDFPKQYVRYVRYQRKPSTQDAQTSIIEQFGVGQAPRGSLGDFELFGEGIPQHAFYLSKIIHLGEELNFGRLFWQTTPMRMVDGSAVEDPTAQASLEVEVRTGRDDDPNIYHEFTDKGRERVVTRERFEKELKPPAVSGGQTQEGRPGIRASIRYDVEHWTYWSSPIVQSGRSLGLASGSFVQLKVNFNSGDFDSFVRLDSLWIERAPLLARRIIGEVARLDEPQPARGFTEVGLGEEIPFAYDLKIDFSGIESRGFDAVRIHTGQRARFIRLEMGEPLQQVDPAAAYARDGELEVHLPQRVMPGQSAPVRIVFATEIFTYATTFEGEVFDSQIETLPQPIEGGDASNALGTNSLRVFGAGRTAALQDLALSTPVITPNGDGANDEVSISYQLFRLPEPVPVALRAFALDGRQVAARSFAMQDSGPQRVRWDGRDEYGALLPPGLYLVEIVLQSQEPVARKLLTLGIAY